LNARSKLFEEYEALVKNIEKLENQEDIMQSRTELEALEEMLMAAEKPMSFGSFAPDIQERF
jgi:hypothetical protein